MNDDTGPACRVGFMRGPGREGAGSVGALTRGLFGGGVGYRVPSDERVVEAIRETLVRHPFVESQSALGSLVRSVLQEEDDAFRVSDARVRRLAVEEGLARVRVRTGTTGEAPREACPVCGASLDAVRNRTLEGGQTVVGVECPRCPYSAGARHEVPLRYEFVRGDEEEDPEQQAPRGPF